jgi:hypothetical protein
MMFGFSDVVRTAALSRVLDAELGLIVGRRSGVRCALGCILEYGDHELPSMAGTFRLMRGAR